MHGNIFYKKICHFGSKCLFNKENSMAGTLNLYYNYYNLFYICRPHGQVSIIGMQINWIELNWTYYLFIIIIYYYYFEKSNDINVAFFWDTEPCILYVKRIFWHWTKQNREYAEEDLWDQQFPERRGKIWIQNKLEWERQRPGGVFSYVGCASLTPEELVYSNNGPGERNDRSRGLQTSSGYLLACWHQLM
jgi:hypothetical protein